MLENGYCPSTTGAFQHVINEIRFLHSCISNIGAGEVVRQKDEYYYPNSIARLKERYGKNIKINLCFSFERYEVLSKKRCMIIYAQEGIEILNGSENISSISNGIFPIVDGLRCRYNGCIKETSSGDRYKANIICYIEG